MIGTAFAQAAPGGAGGMDLMGLLPLILMFVLLYFLLLRPQMKRAKEHRTMLAALQKGDEVVTAGGTLGKVTRVGDNYVTVEIAPNVEITVQKPSIQTLLPKGTIKKPPEHERRQRHGGAVALDAAALLARSAPHCCTPNA